jgi:uncharacterized protein (TIGR02466 family)
MAFIDSLKLHFTELFPLPFLKYLWTDSGELNRELKRLILAKEKVDKGVTTTNIGGWHSKKDLQTWNVRSVHTVLSRIRALGDEMVKIYYRSSSPNLLSDWTIQAWANINRFGHHNKFHTHIRNFNLWSGVYYVSNGINKEASASPAKIIFSDQHGVMPLHLEGFGRSFSVEPEEGLMLLFPSALGHRVEAHSGSDERITIAFNLKNKKFSTPNYELEKK